MTIVTPETYIRAESDRSFHNVQALAGGANRFYHIRSRRRSTRRPSSV